jgi:hypothetical protein
VRFCVRRVAPTVPALAPTKALRSDASVPTRRRSSRAPRAAESAAASSEPPRGAAAVAGSRHEAAAMAAATATTTATSVVPSGPVPIAVDQTAVVESPTTTPRRLGGASWRTGPRQPPSLRRGYW